MKLTNYTKVPTDLLREMIRFATPPGVTNYDISFKNSGDGCLSGWAYHNGTGYHVRNGKCPPLVTVSVPTKFGPVAAPLKIGRRRKAISKGNGYMTHDTFTEHESLLHVIAHELRHLWQKRVPKGRRVWGARGRFSERDADAYGTRIVRHWRRG